MPREKVYGSDAERQQAYRNRKANKDTLRSVERAAYHCIKDEFLQAGLIAEDAGTAQVLEMAKALSLLYVGLKTGRNVAIDWQAVRSHFERGREVSDKAGALRGA